MLNKCWGLPCQTLGVGGGSELSKIGKKKSMETSVLYKDKLTFTVRVSVLHELEHIMTFKLYCENVGLSFQSLMWRVGLHCDTQFLLSECFDQPLCHLLWSSTVLSVVSVTSVRSGSVSQHSRMYSCSLKVRCQDSRATLPLAPPTAWEKRLLPEAGSVSFSWALYRNSYLFIYLLS